MYVVAVALLALAGTARGFYPGQPVVAPAPTEKSGLSIGITCILSENSAFTSGLQPDSKMTTSSVVLAVCCATQLCSPLVLNLHPCFSSPPLSLLLLTPLSYPVYSRQLRSKPRCTCWTRYRMATATQLPSLTLAPPNERYDARGLSLLQCRHVIVTW